VFLKAVHRIYRRPPRGCSGLVATRVSATVLRLLRVFVSVRVDRPRTEPALHAAGGAFKCTFCYDGRKSGIVPGRSGPPKFVRPNQSCFRPMSGLDLRARGEEKRVEQSYKQVKWLQKALRKLYDPTEKNFRQRGIHAVFLILGET